MFTIVGYTQTITLKVTSENEEVAGAHIIVNEKVVAVTDINGMSKVNIKKGDKLQITYIGFNDEKITITNKHISENRNIVINLKPKIFTIDEAKVIAKEDWDILKQKLKKNLKLRTSSDSIPFAMTDTITDTIVIKMSRFITGNAVFKYRGRTPRITSVSVKLIDAGEIVDTSYAVDTVRTENSDAIKKGISELTAHRIGNNMWIANAICKFNKRLKIYYRGKEDNYDIFYFTKKDKIHKYNGLLYLNTNGIIERINCNYISYTSKYSTYHLDTYFEYFTNENTILPKLYFRKNYFLNDNLEIKGYEYESLNFMYD
jgi:hypothetical protein